jgi:hypothetical protein
LADVVEHVCYGAGSVGWVALGRRGSATAAELAEDVPALCAQVVVAAGKAYEATQNVNSRVLRVVDVVECLL